MSEGLDSAIVRAAAIGHSCCRANDGSAGADALALDTRAGHEHRDSS